MKRLGLALLLVACGDDEEATEATTVTPSTSTSDASTGDMSSTSSSSGSSSSSSSDGETVAPTTGNTVDFVNCMQLPNTLAIAIRTALVKDRRLHVQAAAGIVADSDPRSEWLETQHKGRALLTAAAQCGAVGVKVPA